MHSLVVHDDVLLGLPDRDVLLVRTLWQGQIEGLLVCILWWSMLMCYWAFWSLEEMASQGAAPAREPDQRGQRRS